LLQIRTIALAGWRENTDGFRIVVGAAPAAKPYRAST
jgi:hypothetical protein